MRRETLNVVFLPAEEKKLRLDSVQPDVLVITQEDAIVRVAQSLGPARAALIPVIDASGKCHPWADVHISELSEATLNSALLACADLCLRVRSLPEDYLSSQDPRLWLLLRLVTRARAGSAADTILSCP